ncbi:Catalytic LigB subunit of aromatic ring-opening dioxygenase [Frankia sp. AiPs1]|uniref:hypothetical protein n=1 Tax=Frankia sp. AiPa1 TaxID=573492 RepID=UPI00202AFBEB|nr:hypothetical protein [Frankia sp. AiPa1]MCL9758470.1 hypothetical protein [Frankia sp. AiPa1]
MTFVAAAVCPHPPLLVPEVGGAEPVAARPAALAAVRQLTAASPDRIVVVGDAGDVPAEIDYGPATAGTFAGFGVDLSVSLGVEAAVPSAPVLPLSLTVGAWLLATAGWPGARTALGVPSGYSARQAAELGQRLVAASDPAERLGLLVMGDASARRTVKAPGALDERAAPFDAAVAAALLGVDPDGLLGLDAGLAADLLVAGRASWQVLAGALVAATRDDTPRAAWIGALGYDAAPYGVGYLVAVWIRGDAAREGAGE